MTVVALLQTYAQRIRDHRRANPAISEPALAPAFQQLLEGLIPVLPIARSLVVSPEYENPGVGRPDIALIRPGAPPRAFVELKAPSKPVDPTRWRDAHDKKQFERLQELRCWATCNFVEFYLFDRDDETGRAVVVPERALRPDQDDARANRAIAEHDAAPFLRLVETLAAAADGGGHSQVLADKVHGDSPRSRVTLKRSSTAFLCQAKFSYT